VRDPLATETEEREMGKNMLSEDETLILHNYQLWVAKPITPTLGARSISDYCYEPVRKASTEEITEFKKRIEN